MREFEVLRRWHPGAGVVPVAATGGAARELAQKIGGFELDDTNFQALFERALFSAKPEHSYSWKYEVGELINTVQFNLSKHHSTYCFADRVNEGLRLAILRELLMMGRSIFRWLIMG